MIAVGCTQPSCNAGTGDQPWWAGTDDSPIHDRPTRIVDIDLLHARTDDACEDSPTRVVTANVWAAEEAMRRALGLDPGPGRRDPGGV